jgi:peptide/nickel transport system permease protein
MVKTLFKSSKFMIGITILLLLLAFTLIYPMINQGDPFNMDGRSFEAPSERHLLGTDNFGRDVLLELAHASQTSLYVGALAGVIAITIGLLVGLFAGYVGGIVDEILTFVTNIFTVVPSFVILILISVSMETRGAWLTAMVIGFTAWPWTARAVRAQAASLRNRDHIYIAKISGFSVPKIILFEILPYVGSYVVMAFIIQLASGILQESAISMLGLGPTNKVTLGMMLNWALMSEAPRIGAWWTFIPSAAMVGFVTFSLYLINIGMDEIFNPKLRS